MRLYPLISAFALAFSLVSAHAAAPVWTVRDIDQFQDNFASDGTLTGFVRADMANDILPDSSPGILPGDSSVVVVADPISGLATDGVLGGKAVYCYVLVQRFSQPSKTGAALSGGSRWPFAGTESIGGHTWTKLRLDQSDVGGGPVPDNFCIDLNDNLFTPGDTIFFFYAAKSADGPGTSNYFSLETGTVSDINLAAALPMEFTCLPAGGFNRGGSLLYVDAADDAESQICWNMAMQNLGVLDKTDRYDVRGSADGADNSLASRVVNVAGQFNAAYTLIWWDCGSQSITLGDGSGSPLKSDDYAFLINFLGNLTLNGGVLLFGDDVAERLNASTAQSAFDFRQTYLPYVFVSGNHAPLFGAAPTGVHWPGRAFLDDVMIYGGAPDYNDFDVLKATGTSRVEMTYGPAGSANGAVVTNRVVVGPSNKTSILFGFGLASVRENDLDGIPDRALFLKNITRYTGDGPLGVVVGVGPASRSSLQQNHPNPFNPQTSIEYATSERAHVTLAIYDVSGELIRTLKNAVEAAGAYKVFWDGRDQTGKHVASGVYFYKLNAGSFTQTKKMVLLK